MTRFDDCLTNFTWRPDNDGQPFHDEAGDPGGATSWGVTYGTWLSWQIANDQPVDFAVFQNADQASLMPIYHVWFWNALRCDDLPPGIDLCVFDFAVGSSARRSAQFLQQQIGVAVDGRIGPITVAAARAADPATLIALLTRRDEQFYASLATFRLFGRGWDRRREDCRRLALAMSAEAYTKAS